MNTYVFKSVCARGQNVQMISGTTYSSQTELIGESLHVSEHGICYLNLAFTAKAKTGRYSELEDEYKEVTK